MSKQFEVEVIFTNKKVVKVWAKDEDDANDKATEIVSKWENVLDVEEATCLGEV